MDVLSSEATAFLRAADVVGLELPATITELRDRLESLEAESAKLARPEQVPTKTRLLADGTPVDKVTEEHARLTAEARELKELHEALRNARDGVTRRVSLGFAQERDGLILAMRPLVTALVAAARPLAESLAAFAPKYDAGTIVRHATAKQINDWRKAEELEAKFGACLAAWRAAWSDTLALAGTPSPARVPDFDVRWVDPAHWFWACPQRVLEPRLNGTWYAPHQAAPSMIRPTILAVAREPHECGFRLATVREMAELYRDGVRQTQAASGGWRFNTAPVTS